MNQREMRAQLSSRASILEHKLAWESLKYLGVIPEAPSRSPGLVNKLFGGTLDQIVRQHSPEILQRTADGWTLKNVPQPPEKSKRAIYTVPLAARQNYSFDELMCAPSHAALYAELFDVYTKLGREQDAAVLVQQGKKAILPEPHRAKDFAEQFLQFGHLNPSADFFLDYISAYEKDFRQGAPALPVKLLVTAARLLLAAGRYEESLHVAEIAFKAHPSSHTVILLIGQIISRRSQNKELTLQAIKPVMINCRSLSAEDKMTLAQIYFDIGMKDEAIPLLEAVIAVAPELSLEPYARLANHYNDIGDIQRAKLYDFKGEKLMEKLVKRYDG